MIAKGQSENRKHHALVGLTLLFLFVNLYCYTDILPLTGEEDRRCVIAQEMLLSGYYLHPTVFNVPYYKKPPMHNWLIALANLREGGVDRVRARTVSIAALLIMGLSMYLFLLKKRPEGALIGFLAVTTNYLMMCEYGNLAETDMTVTLFTFLSFILYMANPTHLLYVFPDHSDPIARWPGPISEAGIPGLCHRLRLLHRRDPDSRKETATDCLFNPRCVWFRAGPSLRDSRVPSASRDLCDGWNAWPVLEIQATGADPLFHGAGELSIGDLNARAVLSSSPLPLRP